MGRSVRLLLLLFCLALSGRVMDPQLPSRDFTDTDLADLEDIFSKLGDDFDKFAKKIDSLKKKRGVGGSLLVSGSVTKKPKRPQETERTAEGKADEPKESAGLHSSRRQNRPRGRGGHMESSPPPISGENNKHPVVDGGEKGSEDETNKTSFWTGAGELLGSCWRGFKGLVGSCSRAPRMLLDTVGRAAVYVFRLKSRVKSVEGEGQQTAKSGHNQRASTHINSFEEHLARARSALRLRSHTTDILDHVLLEEDLGFFSWSSARTGVSPLEMANQRLSEPGLEAPSVADRVLQQLAGLDLEGKPRVVVDVSSLPLPIAWLDRHDLPNDSRVLGAFPNTGGFPSAIYVAQCRGYPTETLDFVFERSTLAFFAFQKNADRRTDYLLQKHRNTIFVKKATRPFGLYKQHFHKELFQLKRLMSGLPMNSRHPDEQDEHIQVMAFFSKYKVLFSAAADAMDTFGNTIEVKRGRWMAEHLAALFFEMLSSGASATYIGVDEGARGHLLQDPDGDERQRVDDESKHKPKLVAVDVNAFEDVANRLQYRNIRWWTDNVKHAMDSLALQVNDIEEGAVYTMYFSGNRLRFNRAPTEYKSFLPQPDVMNELSQCVASG